LAGKTVKYTPGGHAYDQSHSDRAGDLYTIIMIAER
jgi:hypothetical protein